ncbi:MAG: hypothetical protein SGARI_003968, partial [Bacillariaceae sp.]
MEAQQERPRTNSGSTANREAQRWSRERQANHERAWDDYFTRQQQVNPQWQRERAEASRLSVALPSEILYPAQPRPRSLNITGSRLEILDSDDEESVEEQRLQLTGTQNFTQETNPFLNEQTQRPIPNLTQPSQLEEDQELELQHGNLEAGADADPVGSFEKFYRDNGNSKAVLFAGALGLRASDMPDSRVLDWLEEPYASMPQRGAIPKVKAHLIEEVRRRRLAMGWSAKKSKCSSFNGLQCREFLKNNPITDVRDVAFIRKQEKEWYNLVAKQKSDREEAARIRLSQANWNGNLPYLRLYSCICHSRARQALVRSSAVYNRDELDAGEDHEDSPAKFRAIVAELYNDPSIVFHTEVLPNLHHEFAEPIELRFEDMPGGAITPEEVKTRYGDARA